MIHFQFLFIVKLKKLDIDFIINLRKFWEILFQCLYYRIFNLLLLIYYEELFKQYREEELFVYY